MASASRNTDTVTRETPTAREATPNGGRTATGSGRRLDDPPARSPAPVSNAAINSNAVPGAVSLGNSGSGGNALEDRKKESTKAPPAQPDTLQESSIKILKAMAIYLTLVPLIVVIALKDTYFWYGLIVGLAFSGTLVVVNGALWGFSLKKEPPYILDVALMVYFAVFLAVYMELGQYLLINGLLNITIHGWLAFVMLLSVAVRYPWVLQHAKEAAPQIAWDAPSFRAVVDHVAGVWGASQAITALLCVVPYMLGNWGMNPLNIVFNYVVPYLILAIMLGLTRWWPAFIRVKYFLPKMHQGAVKPEGAAEPDPEAGEGGPTSGGQAVAAGGPTAASTAGTAAAAAAVAAASSGNPLPLLQGAATGQLMLPPPTIMPPGGMIMQTPSNSLPFQQSFMATPQPYRSGPYPGPPIQMSQLPSPHPQQQGAPSPIASQQYQPPPSLNPQQQGAAAPPQPGALAAERAAQRQEAFESSSVGRAAMKAVKQAKQ